MSRHITAAGYPHRFNNTNMQLYYEAYRISGKNVDMPTIDGPYSVAYWKGRAGMPMGAVPDDLCRATYRAGKDDRVTDIARGNAMPPLVLALTFDPFKPWKPK